MSSAGCGHHGFTPFFFFALFQGSPLKREPCSRSQRFPPRSDLVRAAQPSRQQEGTGHAPIQLPPLGTRLHPQHDQHGGFCPGRVSSFMSASPRAVTSTGSSSPGGGHLAGLARSWEKAPQSPSGAATSRQVLSGVCLLGH